MNSILFRIVQSFLPVHFKYRTGHVAEMENAGANIEELRIMGIQNNDIRQLFTGKEIYYTGNLCNRGKRKSYPVKNVKIDIAKGGYGFTTIWLNGTLTHFKDFIRETWNTLQRAMEMKMHL